MATHALIFVIFLWGCCVPIKSLQSQVNDEAGQDFYTAGVVEFRPKMFGFSSADMLAQHLSAYEEIIRSTAANETDIIVFPEGTLNNNMQMTFVPAVNDNVIPCLAEQQNLYADFLKQLSCIARDVKKYLVINLTEKEKCLTSTKDPRPCASNGLNVYNTNVVFDRNGQVVSRYRKVHVYVEAKNTTYEPEYAIFDTDFGVRFGHFICFDILFYTPALELVNKHGVKNLIFTSLFYSELPFLTSAQLQQSWAWGNNVNLLAAGASYPAVGATGSGIYRGNQGHLVSAMVGGTGERKLYVARVPKTAMKSKLQTQTQLQTTSNKRRATGIKLMKDPQIDNYESRLLQFNENPHATLSLCHRGFCCNLNVSASYKEPPQDALTYQYRFGVYKGRRTYVEQEWSDIRVCALYTCTSEDPLSCGEAFDDKANVVMNIKFENIELNAHFEKTHEMLIAPSTLDAELYSLNADFIDWRQQNKDTYYDVDMKLTKPHENLLTFGIYSNYFERSSGALLRNTPALLVCALIGLLVVNFSIIM